MLRRLYLRDFVIVDALELEFDEGFGALTGETGAGKSILVDALALALGERGDAAVVRHGRERAEIGAEFRLAAAGRAAQWLAENDCAGEGDVCLLRRVIDSAGRSRAYINGRPATLGQLRELGDELADIHGQHDHHALLRSDTQRTLFDAHAGLTGLAREVVERFRAWQKLAAARRSAQSNAEAVARERDSLQWQIKELSDLGFEAHEWEELDREQRRLAHAAALMQGVAEALGAIDEADGAAAGQLLHVASRLGDLAGYDAALQPVRELVEGAHIQVQEAARHLRHYRERLDLDPQRLARVEDRLQAVHQVARKHRTAPADLPALQARLAARLSELETLADAEALAQQEAQMQAAYLEVGKRLSAARQAAAPPLAEAVTAAMQELAMPGGRFEVALEPLAEESAAGLESVEFRVAANASQPLRPLAKVASGGELSRIGLAIQVITSTSSQTQALIFDEVDVGIGGRVAEIVGHRLKTLGRERQVLCVTHLPQVAAQADWQWSIAKETVAGEAVSRVTQLAGAARVEEIARMLGGVKITATTRKHAAEMLGL